MAWPLPWQQARPWASLCLDSLLATPRKVPGMTGSILTPFTLVAIVIILGCVLAALFFLARRRTPSVKPAPRDSKAPEARPAARPRLSPPPQAAARPPPDDGPGRTVLMQPGSPPPPRAAGAGAPAREERRGMDEIEHRRRAANTRLKGERPHARRQRRQRIDAGARDNRGIGCYPRRPRSRR